MKQGLSGTPTPDGEAMSVCYLYVLPLAGEDILKLGIARDPFVRALAFSRRYYEFFDLSRSVLVEYDSRKEAQARETELHRRMCDWNAVQPITVRAAAAGKTEWYRGAYDRLLEELEHDEAQGRAVHRDALPWWRARLRAEREKLYEWIVWITRDDACPLPACERQRRLADVLDSYAQLGVPLESAVPEELASLAVICPPHSDDGTGAPMNHLPPPVDLV